MILAYGKHMLKSQSICRHLKDPSYEEKVLAVFRKLKDNNPADGLMPLYIDIHSGRVKLSLGPGNQGSGHRARL